MKKVVNTSLIILAILASIAYMARPEIPENDCTVKNEDLAKLCLSYIPKHYDAGHLTYLGHTKTWVYRWSDKLGVKLGQQQVKDLAKYSSFEDAVNCYFTASGDASLNMLLTPIEFEARYGPIAEEYENQ